MSVKALIPDARPNYYVGDPRDLEVVAQGQLTARREQETLHPYRGTPHGSIWVVRDERGYWVDADKYRNDLKDRYPGLVIVGD